MTPIGHSAVSYLWQKIFTKLDMKYLIIGGVLPDIDFVLLFLSNFNQIHRAWTHNIFFAIVACIVLSFFKLADRKVKLLSLFIGILLHLLVDSILDSNPSNGIGVAIFFPISNYYFSPFNLSFVEANKGWNDLPAMLWQSLKLFYIELPVCLIALFLLLKSKKKNQIDNK